MEEIRQSLLNKQRQIDNQVTTTCNTLWVDPISSSPELGTAVFEEEIRNEREALKKSLGSFSDGIKKSLKKIELGTYGICEKCCKAINPERLKILPMATTCVNCLAPKKIG